MGLGMRLDDWYALTERDEERELRRKLGSFSHKACRAAVAAFQALGVVFAFAAVAALVTVLCA